MNGTTQGLPRVYKKIKTYNITLKNYVKRKRKSKVSFAVEGFACAEFKRAMIEVII